MLEDEKTSEKIIVYAYKVYNTLGSGFLESVYEKSMLVELKSCGLRAESQVPIKVWYFEENVGDFTADLFVESKIIVELKAVEKIASKHEVQLVNYLVATKMNFGLLINFGPDGVEIKRKFGKRAS